MLENELSVQLALISVCKQFSLVPIIVIENHKLVDFYKKHADIIGCVIINWDLTSNGTLERLRGSNKEACDV